MIKVTLPNGTAVETETAAEAAMLLQALHPMVQIAIPEPSGPEADQPGFRSQEEDKPVRTRKVVRNWELSVLEGWVLEHNYRDPQQKKAVLELARRLGRTEASTRNLVRRYLAGVYSVSSPNDADHAVYDVTKDPSRGESK